MIKRIVYFLFGAIVAGGAFLSNEAYEKREVIKFLERNSCVDIGPPKEGSESTKYFSNAYVCNGVLVTIPK